MSWVVPRRRRTHIGGAAQSDEGKPQVSTFDEPPAAAPRRRLDVRPLLEAGEEPFEAIMAAVAVLEPDAVLVLSSNFEPAPLHGVLAERGFSHRSREVAPGDWETSYWRAQAADAPEVVLDVRGLSPPEPLDLTLAALGRLEPGRRLLQINDRVPTFLLPLLDERGYRHRIDTDERGILVTIWHPAD